MSGIAGIVHADGRDVAPAMLHRIADAAAIRARDGIAFWQDGPAGLIRFRLATTPEAVGERQPRPAPSGDVIAFDGRLDNRAELLALLGPNGTALRDRPDDEIAMALFTAIGDGFMRHLAGDYALAIWQAERRRLFCARAPVGYRPFYFAADHARLAFASEPRALVVGLPLERRLNEPMIAEYLAQRHVTRGETFWRGLRTLPQGSALEYRGGTLRQWHWDDAPYEDLSRASEREHVERFDALFDAAIIACTRSHTGVVAQVSGGLDSSSVLTRATMLHRAGRIDRPVAAITARFPGSPVDETAFSSAVERDLGLTARVVTGGKFDLDAARDWSATTLHLPLRPNAIDTMQNTFRDLARHGERVLLSGEGGDEFLNGNHVHWADEIRRGRIDLIARQAFAAPGTTAMGGLRSIVMQSLGPNLGGTRYRRVARREVWAGTPHPDVLRADWLDRADLAARERASRPALRLRGIAAQNRYSVVEAAWRDVLLAPLQALAASHGVEYRHPLYDIRLIRFYLGASGDVLFRRGERRHLLREAMRGTLVDTVRTRTGKAAFNTLVIEGLETLYRRRPIERQWPVRLGWVDGDRLRAIWNTFRQWRDDGARLPVPPLAFGAMWNTAALDIWLEHAFGL